MRAIEGYRGLLRLFRLAGYWAREQKVANAAFMHCTRKASLRLDIGNRLQKHSTNFTARLEMQLNLSSRNPDPQIRMGFARPCWLQTNINLQPTKLLMYGFRGLGIEGCLGCKFRRVSGFMVQGLGLGIFESDTLTPESQVSSWSRRVSIDLSTPRPLPNPIKQNFHARSLGDGGRARNV